MLSARRTGAGANWIRGLHEGGELALTWRNRWPGVTDIQGGQPLLLESGEFGFEFPCDLSLCPAHPRTGVGVGPGCEDEDGSTRCLVFFVVVDGRQAGSSVGMKLVAFARLFRRLGVSSALTGSSATRATTSV